MASEGGRYKRLRVLASGGMATVHLGRAQGAGGFERLVAIKVMHPHLAGDEEFVSMFLDEARLAAGIRHPNVVSVLDVEAGDEGVSIVMDYVEGPSLLGLLGSLEDRGTPLSVEMALRIAIDALAGLHAAHQLEGPGGVPLGIVHRDVSPHNFLIGNDGVTRITDFGVAHAESRLAETRPGTVKGKIAYMSPEHLRSVPVDRRSDVYSAGVVLWEMLTARRLFKGESDAAVAMSAVAGPLESPRDVNERVPPAIDDVCMRALSKNPDDRWPTAAAFADALEDAAASAGLRIARARDLAELVQQIEEDGPTRLKSDAAAEWLAKLAASKPASSAPRTPPPPRPPADADEVGTVPLPPPPALPRDDEEMATRIIPSGTGGHPAPSDAQARAAIGPDPRTASGHPALGGANAFTASSHPAMGAPNAFTSSSHPAMGAPNAFTSSSHPAMGAPNAFTASSHPAMGATNPLTASSHPGMRVPDPMTSSGHPALDPASSARSPEQLLPPGQQQTWPTSPTAVGNLVSSAFPLPARPPSRVPAVLGGMAGGLAVAGTALWLIIRTAGTAPTPTAATTAPPAAAPTEAPSAAATDLAVPPTASAAPPATASASASATASADPPPPPKAKTTPRPSLPQRVPAPTPRKSKTKISGDL